MDLPEHEANSAARAERVIGEIHKLGMKMKEGSKMSDNASNYDKVNVHNLMPDGAGFGGMGGMGGFGGLAAGVLLAALFGNRRGGSPFGGGDDGCAAELLIANKLGDISTGVAVSAGRTENIVQSSTAALILAGNQNTTAILQRINDIESQNLNRQITVLANEVSDLRNEGRVRGSQRDIEITMTQTQAQAQAQVQIQDLTRLVHSLCSELQVSRVTNKAINVGSGTQLANPLNTSSNVHG